jgi:RHS repeat-associated protein
VFYWAHQDHLGSGHFLTALGGSVAYRGEYDPHGQMVLETAPVGNYINSKKFTGYERNWATGLDYAKARNYQRTRGRFTTPDPLSVLAADLTNPQSLNRYAYVGNDPINFVDPTGLLIAICEPDRGYCDSTGCHIIAGSCYLIGGGGGGYGGGGGIGHDPFGGGGGGVVDGGGTGGGSGDGSAKNNSVKKKVCDAIPAGRTAGVSGGLGGVGAAVGGGEIVVNYNSGQVSAFAFGGVQVGWNGGVSGTVYAGYIRGLNNTNSNYAGGFTGGNGGYGPGGFVASSSGGLTGSPRGMVPDWAVTAADASFGGSLIPTPTGGVSTTNYTKPLQLGRFWAFSPADYLLSSAGWVKTLAFRRRL